MPFAPDGAYVSSGLTCIHLDDDDARTLFLCNVNDILKSTDEGKTFRLVFSSPVQQYPPVTVQSACSRSLAAGCRHRP